MTLKHLKIFATVCKEGSITKAARVLYMSQPAVSLAIRQIEEEYQTVLFDRISHRLHLTHPGQIALDYAESILNQFDELSSALLQQSASEHLSIGNSVGSPLFSYMMKEFEHKYPEVKTSVVTDHTKTITNMVINNQFDIGTVEGIPASPELESVVFAKEVMVVCASSSHPLAKRKGLHLSDLSNERFLLREQFSGARAVVDSVFQAHRMTVKPYWESSASLVILDAIRYGIGIAILPQSLIVPYLNDGSICILDISDATFEFPYSIVYRVNKFKPRSFQKFVSHFVGVHNSVLIDKSY